MKPHTRYITSTPGPLYIKSFTPYSSLPENIFNILAELTLEIRLERQYDVPFL